MCGTENDSGPVVHARVEQRGCVNQPIDVGDGDGDLSTSRGCPQEPGSGGAVQQEPVTVAGVGDREHHRLTVKAQGDVRDQSGVEDLVKHLAITDLAVAEPVHAGAFGDGQQVRRHDCHCVRQVV